MKILFRLTVIPFVFLVFIGLFLNFFSFIITGKEFLRHFKTLNSFFNNWEEKLFSRTHK